jgi:hypothetical protein
MRGAHAAEQRTLQICHIEATHSIPPAEWSRSGEDDDEEEAQREHALVRVGWGDARPSASVNGQRGRRGRAREDAIEPSAENPGTRGTRTGWQESRREGVTCGRGIVELKKRAGPRRGEGRGGEGRRGQETAAMDGATRVIYLQRRGISARAARRGDGPPGGEQEGSGYPDRAESVGEMRVMGDDAALPRRRCAGVRDGQRMGGRTGQRAPGDDGRHGGGRGGGASICCGDIDVLQRLGPRCALLGPRDAFPLAAFLCVVGQEILGDGRFASPGTGRPYRGALMAWTGGRN